MEKIPLLLMFLGHMAVDAFQGTLPVVMAKLKEVFGLSYLQIGLMMLLLNLSSSVIQPIFGIISDRFRTGWFIPSGSLILTVFLACGAAAGLYGGHLSDRISAAKAS